MNNVAVTELGYVGVGIRDIDAWRFLLSDYSEWSGSQRTTRSS